MDIRQIPNYANYIQSYGWKVEKVGEWNAFIKKFPIVGSLIKIQRIAPPIPFEEIKSLAKIHHAFKVIVEFNVIARSETTKQSQSQSSHSFLTPDSLLTSQPHSNNFRPCRSPFLPTKTIILDINKSESEILNSFSKEKRRLLKRLEENKEIIIREGTVEDFIDIKKRGLLEKHIYPFGIKKEINSLWQSFSPNNILILVANTVIARNEVTKQSQGEVTAIRRDPAEAGQSRPIAGALFIFNKNKAHYWEASSIKLGKKLSAPSLLVWEGIKIAKQKGCEIFDLEGIYDERFPNKSWLGFTHFKKEFGGAEIEFPPPIQL